ncbi:MAG: nitroreductase family protein [Bacteroidota bacterium]|nr:nitroreductase family protein [Bacteroidota bacterium]
MIKYSKPAPADVEIHSLLKERWSPRAFSEKMPDRKVLRRLFEAARWAPSSSNEQSWRFIVGIKGENGSWEKVFSCLDDGNREWCKRVPVLVLACAKKHFSFGRQAENKHYGHDVGQSLAHLTVQAMHEDLFVHQMAGFDVEKTTEVFSIPEEFLPFTCAAIGYQDDPDVLEEKNAARERGERKRKLIQETVFGDGWEKPLFV